ncbi:zinc finger protein 250-like [Dendropsophus ebraccatus]|uniref:zinc finger protein 250-like n=1 Tax=Dendropsophus ebraccatus TaxID=150705 RepID=UPI0038319A81
MPKCLVASCHNSAGMRRNSDSAVLHAFPTTLESIKSWLRSLEAEGQVCGDLEEMAARIHQGERPGWYRVCSEHFSPQCYTGNGEVRVLNESAVPTIFTPAEPESSGTQAEERKIGEDGVQSTPTTARPWEELTQVLLSLTLEILHLLTGEDYGPVTKTPGEYGRRSRTQSPITESPRSVVDEEDNAQKILHLTRRITDLLTGEVPIRCQDVAVYFSMEEWEYVEGHKDLYQDAMMEDQPPLTASGLPCEERKSLPHVTRPTLTDQPTSCNSDHQKSSCRRMCEIISKSPTSQDEKDPSENNVKRISTFVSEEGGGDLTNPHTIEPHSSPQGMVERMATQGNLPAKGKIGAYTPTDHTPHSPLTYPDTYTHTDHTPHSPLPYPDTYTHTGHTPHSPLTYPDTYTHTDHTPHSPLTYPDTYTHTDHTPHSPLTYPDTYTHTDHTPHRPLTYPDTYTHTGHTPHSPLTYPDTYTHTDHTPHSPPTHRKMECAPHEGENILVNILTDHALYTSTCINFEPMDHSQYPAAHIKVEPVDHTQYTPTHIKVEPVDYTQYTPTHIKVEPVDHTQYTPTHIKVEPVDHTQYPAAHIKVEPVDHTQYTPTHIKVEPVNHTQYPAAHIKVEPVDHTQYPAAHINSEPISHEEGDLTLTNTSSKLANHLQHSYSHIKEEEDTYDGVDATNMSVSTDHTQPYPPSSYTKEEPVSQQGREDPDAVPFFQCTECSEGFTSRADLIYHQTVHRIEKLKCPECGKCFSTKSNLCNHIRSHTGEKPYSCPACAKRFTRKSTLIIHQRIHTGEKPFDCRECGRCFPSRGNLMKHLKVHKPKRPMTVKTFLHMPMAFIVESSMAQMIQ